MLQVEQYFFKFDFGDSNYC